MCFSSERIDESVWVCEREREKNFFFVYFFMTIILEFCKVELTLVKQVDK